MKIIEKTLRFLSKFMKMAVLADSPTFAFIAFGLFIMVKKVGGA